MILIRVVTALYDKYLISELLLLFRMMTTMTRERDHLTLKGRRWKTLLVVVGCRPHLTPTQQCACITQNCQPLDPGHPRQGSPPSKATPSTPRTAEPHPVTRGRRGGGWRMVAPPLVRDTTVRALRLTTLLKEKLQLKKVINYTE